MFCSFLPPDIAAVFRGSDLSDFNFSPICLYVQTADRDVIIKELRDKGRVFALIPGRSHESFSNFVCNPVKEIEYDELIKWLQECANNIAKLHLEYSYKIIN